MNKVTRNEFANMLSRNHSGAITSYPGILNDSLEFISEIIEELIEDIPDDREYHLDNKLHVYAGTVKRQLRDKWL